MNNFQLSNGPRVYFQTTQKGALFVTLNKNKLIPNKDCLIYESSQQAFASLNLILHALQQGNKVISDRSFGTTDIYAIADTIFQDYKALYPTSMDSWLDLISFDKSSLEKMQDIRNSIFQLPLHPNSRVELCARELLDENEYPLDKIALSHQQKCKLLKKIDFECWKIKKEGLSKNYCMRIAVLLDVLNANKQIESIEQLQSIYNLLIELLKHIQKPTKSNDKSFSTKFISLTGLCTLLSRIELNDLEYGLKTALSILNAAENRPIDQRLNFNMNESIVGLLFLISKLDRRECSFLKDNAADLTPVLFSKYCKEIDPRHFKYLNKISIMENLFSTECKIGELQENLIKEITALLLPASTNDNEIQIVHTALQGIPPDSLTVLREILKKSTSLKEFLMVADIIKQVPGEDINNAYFNTKSFKWFFEATSIQKARAIQFMPTIPEPQRKAFVFICNALYIDILSQIMDDFKFSPNWNFEDFIEVIPFASLFAHGWRSFEILHDAINIPPENRAIIISLLDHLLFPGWQKERVLDSRMLHPLYEVSKSMALMSPHEKTKFLALAKSCLKINYNKGMELLPHLAAIPSERRNRILMIIEEKLEQIGECFSSYSYLHVEEVRHIHAWCDLVPAFASLTDTEIRYAFEAGLLLVFLERTKAGFEKTCASLAKIPGDPFDPGSQKALVIKIYKDVGFKSSTCDYSEEIWLFGAIDYFLTQEVPLPKELIVRILREAINT